MKRIAAGLAGLGAALTGLIVIAVSLVAVLIGAVVSTTGGATGAMFADENIKKQYGLFGCETAGGPGVPMSGTQTDYIRTMIGVAKTMGVNEEGQVIAAMTMAQESNFKNYANNGENARGFGGFPEPGAKFWLDVARLSLKYPHDAVANDADSVGLFQQRASAGWADDESLKARDDPEGAIKRLLDPRWGAQQFFGGPGGASNRGLLDIPGWESMPKGRAAQRVQISAFPDAYNKWENQARQLVRENQDAPALELVGGGGGSGAAPSSPSGDAVATSDSGDSNGVQYPLAEGTYNLTSGYGMRTHPVTGIHKMHPGQDFAAAHGTPIHSIADGVVVETGHVTGYGNWVIIDHNLNGKKYSSLYAHIHNGGTLVSKGDQVTKGQHIAGVGTTGWSTGNHLHFEIWEGGKFDGGHHIEPMAFLGGTHVSSAVTSSVECNGGGSAASTMASGSTADIFKAFEDIIGTPYSWGGGTTGGPSKGFGPGAATVGFDCSSAVQYAVYHGTGGKNGGLLLPRTAQEQFNHTKGQTVWSSGDLSSLQPGDLLFWGSSTSNITHVAIYKGNNRMYEAPRTGLNVRETDVYTNRLVAATRLDLSSSSSGESGDGED